jgi:hypothetical protein
MKQKHYVPLKKAIIILKLKRFKLEWYIREKGLPSALLPNSNKRGPKESRCVDIAEARAWITEYKKPKKRPPKKPVEKIVLPAKRIEVIFTEKEIKNAIKIIIENNYKLAQRTVQLSESYSPAWMQAKLIIHMKEPILEWLNKKG